MIDLPKNSETAIQYLTETLKISISDFDQILFKEISSRLNAPKKKTWRSIFSALLKVKPQEINPTYLLYNVSIVDFSKALEHYLRSSGEDREVLIESLNTINRHLVNLGKVFIHLSGVRTNIEISLDSYRISIHYSTLKYVPNKQQSQSSVLELPEPKSLQWSEILTRKINVLRTIFAEIKKMRSFNQNEQEALEFLKDFIIYYIVYMHHKGKESTILNPYAEL